LTFNYLAIHAISDEILAAGQTAHVFTDPEGKPRRLPTTSPLWEFLLSQELEPISAS
jgi:hypothetical protein